MSKEVQPIFILPEGSTRTTGRDAQRNNIMAAKLVAETVRTTLGPKGMDKMIVDSLGDVVITNDGVTILDEMNIEHPSAKMIVEIAKTQEDEVGDGTTTAVVIAGELLKNAEDLLDQKLHPTVIAKGYQMAAEKAQQILNSIAVSIDMTNKDALKNIAMTAMTGKGAEVNKERLAELTTDAVIQVADEEGNIDSDNIKIEKKVGESAESSILIKGILLDKEKVHSAMPKKVDNAKILLLDCPVEIKETETDAKIQISDPMQMQAFLEQEERMLKKIVDNVIKTGANVVFCQKGIDDMAQHYLAKAGIFAARRVKKSDMEKLAKATGGSILSTLEAASDSDLGNAGTVREEKVGDEYMTYVENCQNPKAVTLLVRGGTDHVIEEVKRAVDDAVGDLIAALKNGKIVGGAGAPEVEVAKELKKYAETLSGREQLAVQKFAEAMEVIPKTLAENGGLDPIDIMTELKALHDKGEKWAGVNVFTGKAMDSFKEGIIEPLKIKSQAIKSASEVAVMILRIDDVIAGGGSRGGPGPGDMPHGMPGMGPGM
ncbi:TCP-1/cpn60 chaperonin family protein [Candidatus Woesearchaeota archaeon]|nr:TCP-1/cpn60 chaperonin family protein [Candidatus Woesearchaeota archaeon]